MAIIYAKTVMTLLRVADRLIYRLCHKSQNACLVVCGWLVPPASYVIKAKTLNYSVCGGLVALIVSFCRSSGEPKRNGKGNLGLAAVHFSRVKFCS